jgi:NadR type nicotinamide-nucleotide adenylyltransferase
MEKEFNPKSMKGRIVITGPESTGKTSLCLHLASVYNTIYIPEFARKYISDLKSPYTYCDVLNIALEQVKLERMASQSCDGFVFFDTWLIITKIWFREVYSKYPSWIDEKLNEIKIDLFLLCAPDIAWVADSVRENGGQRRFYLFDEYEKEIKKLNAEYRVIRGDGPSRFTLAEKYINEHFKL